MADVHSAAIRSKNMRAIRTQDTAIEKRLASLLDELGLSYHMQDKSLPGRPDFVLTEQQTIIFVHGCFWHHHHCYLFKLPTTRSEFWLNKINSNVARDRRDISALTAAGWQVLIVWECALRGKRRLDNEAIRSRLEEWIFAGNGNAAIDYQGISRLPDTEASD